jgi:hypothetical protein
LVDGRFGIIRDVGPMNATLLWEDSGRYGVVDVQDLISEEQAKEEALVRRERSLQP